MVCVTISGKQLPDRSQYVDIGMGIPDECRPRRIETCMILCESDKVVYGGAASCYPDGSVKMRAGAVSGAYYGTLTYAY